MHILGYWNTIQILMSWYNKISIYRTLWLKNEKKRMTKTVMVGQFMEKKGEGKK